MLISQLINSLESIKATKGDIPVYHIDDYGHTTPVMYAQAERVTEDLDYLEELNAGQPIVVMG